MKTLAMGWLLLNTTLAMAQASENGAVLTIKEENFSFDTLSYAGNATHTFEITNTGNEPLILTRVSTSCGCDMAEGPREPIAPGKSGFIKYKYDSKRVGPFTKTISITGNFVGGSRYIRVKGYVLPPPVEATHLPAANPQLPAVKAVLHQQPTNKAVEPKQPAPAKKRHKRGHKPKRMKKDVRTW